MSITDRNNLGFDYESPAYRFGSLETQANNCLCVPLVYGKARAAGNKIWQSSGSDTFSALVAFAEGEITGFFDIRINDILITDSALSGCSYTAYLGNGSQAIDSRVTGSTQADKAALVGGLKHTAYLALTIKTCNKVANNYMDVSAVLQGKAVRVYTNTTTYTTVYSNNPVWCILDFLTCYNGCGLSHIDIDIQAFIDAAAYCDEKINPVNATGTVSVTSGSATVTGSGTKFLTEVKVGDQITVNSVNKTVSVVSSDTSLTADSNFSGTASGHTMVVRDTRFALNLILDTRRSRQDWLNEMLICCRGFLVYNGSKASIIIEQDKQSLQSFTQDDIIAESEIFWTTPKEQRCDIFKVRYLDPTNQYARAYAVAEADTFLNSPPIVQEIVALGITSFKQSSRLAWFYLNQANTCDKFFSFTTTKKALDRASGDLIDLTSTFLGYQNKKMFIVSMNETQEGQIQLICREYNGGNFSTLTTNLTGTNNDLTYTSKKANTDANNITVTYLDPGQASQSISVSVVGNAISVNLATNGSGTIISTANDVKTAVTNSSAASALLSVALATGNDGTGVVTATTMMNLSGATSGIYADTLGSVAPTINTEYTSQETLPQRAVTKVIAANNTADKRGADKTVSDDSTSAQNVINEAISEIPLSSIEAGSASSISAITSTVPVMTSNTTPSGTASASSVNTYTGTTNLIPTMTSNTTPSGTASANSEYTSPSRAAWMAMDSNSDTFWTPYAAPRTQGWLQYQLTSAKIVTKYTILNSYNIYCSPKDWTFQGSNNGTSWTTLDTQTNQTGWVLNTKRTYSFSNSTPYSYYRINITSDNGGGAVVITQWELFEQISYEAWKSLNQTNTDQYDCWMANATTGTLQYQFSTAKTIIHYSITSRNDSDQTISPKTWKLQGSNNGTDWTDLDTQSNITSWSQGETKIYHANNSTAYTYYRLNVNANNGNANYLAVGELKLADSTASMLITLDNTANTTDDYYNGLYLKFTSGNCSGEMKSITDYVGSTKVATVGIFSALPSAGDHLEIMSYSARISLLEGTYIIDDPIVLKSGIKLEGQGAGTVIKLKDSKNADMNLIEASSVKFVQVANLYLDGNKSNQTSGNQVGVSFASVQSSNISNILLNKLSSIGIKLDNCSNNIISSNILTNNSAQGIYLNNSTSITVQNNSSNKITSTGIYISGTTSSTINGNGCINCTSGIILDSSSNNNTLSGNTCNNNSSSGMEIKSSNNNSVSTNTCTDNSGDGVVFDNSDNNTVTGNTCCGNGKLTNNIYSNILVKNDSDYNNLQSNTSRSASTGNKPKYGLRIDTSNCDKNISSNNDLIGTDAYGTAAYSDAGTGTVATNNRTTS